MRIKTRREVAPARAATARRLRALRVRRLWFRIRLSDELRPQAAGPEHRIHRHHRVTRAGPPQRFRHPLRRCRIVQVILADVGKTAGSVPGVVSMTATDYPAGGVRGKLLEAEPVTTRSGTSRSSDSPL